MSSAVFRHTSDNLTMINTNSKRQDPNFVLVVVYSIICDKYIRISYLEIILLPVTSTNSFAHFNLVQCMPINKT